MSSYRNSQLFRNSTFGEAAVNKIVEVDTNKYISQLSMLNKNSHEIKDANGENMPLKRTKKKSSVNLGQF